MNLALRKMCLQMAEKERASEISFLICEMVWRKNWRVGVFAHVLYAQGKLYFYLEYCKLDLDIAMTWDRCERCNCCKGTM